MEAYRVYSVDDTSIVASIEALRFYAECKVLSIFTPDWAKIPQGVYGLYQTAAIKVPATRHCQYTEMVPEDMIPEAPGHAIRLAPGKDVECPMSRTDHVHIQDVMARMDVYGCPIYHPSELVEALRMI